MAARLRKANESKRTAVPAPAGIESAAPASDSASVRTTARTLALITLVIGLPYALYCLYIFVHLGSGLLRHPIGVTDARQLLIVGSQSSGTTQMAAALSKLGLEVAHEASDTTSQFARDGTVSWFHGIRFLQGEAPASSLDLLCMRSYRNMGFHPAAFRHTGCSIRVEWDACWQRECRAIISESWGCAVTAGRACETPFDRTLLQNRHPLRTMESLLVKFCRSETAPASPALTLFSRALWPSHDWGNGACLPVIAAYVTNYYEAMLEAVAAGHITGMYRLENATTCEVAALAGFGTALFPPAREAFERACSGSGATGADLAGNVRNQRNQGLVRLALADIAAIDAKLAQRVAALGTRMGYDPLL